MDIRETVELDEEDAKALKQLNDKQVAVQQFVQMISAQGEQRLSQLQSEGRGVWGKIAKKNDLDLNKVHYTLNDEGTALIATAVKLNGS